jgi:hypothetical protein
MSPHRAVHGGLAGLLALVITFVLNGCGRTLVFAEQTGFNLSIIASLARRCR